MTRSTSIYFKTFCGFKNFILGEIESADSVIATLVVDANKILTLSAGDNLSLKSILEQKLARVGNNLVTVRKKVAKHCDQQTGFNDSRSISR